MNQMSLLAGTSSMQTVHVVASCTQGKRLPVPSNLRLGSIAEGPLAERLEKWRGRLQQTRVASVAAVDLYRGHHWAVVRELPSVAQKAGCQADLWVASAGYGLLPAEARVRPYSATFSGSEDDCVWRPSDGDRRTALRTWWNGLQEIPEFAKGSPRSLEALAGTAPDSVILLIASPAYIVAMADDLEAARARLTDSQRLIIVSSRHDSLQPEWLKSHLVPSEAPLTEVLGGSRGALHARTARRILQEAATTSLRADVLVPYYERLLSEMQRSAVPARLKLSDEDVRQFIREAIAGNGKLACTSALRNLRRSGQACEQRRFAALYAEVRREANAA